MYHSNDNTSNKVFFNVMESKNSGAEHINIKKKPYILDCCTLCEIRLCSCFDWIPENPTSSSRSSDKMNGKRAN